MPPSSRILAAEVGWLGLSREGLLVRVGVGVWVNKPEGNTDYTNYRKQWLRRVEFVNRFNGDMETKIIVNIDIVLHCPEPWQILTHSQLSLIKALDQSSDWSNRSIPEHVGGSAPEAHRIKHHHVHQELSNPDNTNIHCLGGAVDNYRSVRYYSRFESHNWQSMPDILSAPHLEQEAQKGPQVFFPPWQQAGYPPKHSPMPSTIEANCTATMRAITEKIIDLMHIMNVLSVILRYLVVFDQLIYVS